MFISFHGRTRTCTLQFGIFTECPQEKRKTRKNLQFLARECCSFEIISFFSLINVAESLWSHNSDYDCEWATIEAKMIRCFVRFGWLGVKILEIMRGRRETKERTKNINISICISHLLCCLFCHRRQKSKFQISSARVVEYTNLISAIHTHRLAHHHLLSPSLSMCVCLHDGWCGYKTL